MTTALPSHTTSTVSITKVRDFIQDRANDARLLQILESEFDPIPAAAMLRHRVPLNSWREDHLDGTAFHAALVRAVDRRISASDAPRQLRPALRILDRFGFAPLPEIDVDDLLVESPALGVRGKLDLVGHFNGQPALVEIKTVHRIPHDYAHLEHAVQASLLFSLAWDRAPRPGHDRVVVLYVESTAPHAAFLRAVQLPHRFINVGSRIAAHLLRRN